MWLTSKCWWQSPFRVVAVAVCVLVVVAVAVCVLVVSTLGLLGLLPALPRGLLRNASPVGGEAHEAILDAPGHAVPVEVANPSPHAHSIFCLLSLTPGVTNAMLFCSRFILSIWTRRHL